MIHVPRIEPCGTPKIFTLNIDIVLNGASRPEVCYSSNASSRANIYILFIIIGGNQHMFGVFGVLTHVSTSNEIVLFPLKCTKNTENKAVIKTTHFIH